ncbi:MAG: DUF1257 domain-containing protein [Synechococcaceae cyanobacterium]|nr:DUF1257 domain-containing protein [Synechococcaceae cyanobacterium]
MSHFSTIQTELRDRQSLELALGDLGHAPTAGPLPVRGYRGQTVMADLALVQTSGADIGFRLNPSSGCYELVTDLDLWNQSVPVERFLSQLNQRYALRAILAASQEEGFQVSSQTDQLDGSIELVVTRWDA